jgi:hypothetical protein
MGEQYEWIRSCPAFSFSMCSSFFLLAVTTETHGAVSVQQPYSCSVGTMEMHASRMFLCMR